MSETLVLRLVLARLGGSGRLIIARPEPITEDVGLEGMYDWFMGGLGERAVEEDSCR